MEPSMERGDGAGFATTASLVTVAREEADCWPEAPCGPHDTAFLQMGKGDLRLTVDGIARFRIHHGERIAYDPWSEEVSEQDLRTFLLGSAVGALLIQRGMLVLHGNALEREGKAIVCLGHSGAGKSTLAYSLMRQGWRLLADDLVAITREGLVLPGIPRIKLWHDAALAFGLDPQALPPIRQGMEKYLVIGSSVQRAAVPSPLEAVYAIDPQRAAHPSEQPITPIASERTVALLLRNNAYRPRFVRGLGQEGSNFLLLTQLQRRVPVAVLPLPEGIPAMERWLEERDLLRAVTQALRP